MQKSILDKMPDFIHIPVILTLDFTVLFGRNNGLHRRINSHFNDFIRIITAIRQKCFRAQTVNQSAGFFAISSGTFCNNNSDRHTMRIHGQVYLGVEPPFVRLMA